MSVLPPAKESKVKPTTQKQAGGTLSTPELPKRRLFGWRQTASPKRPSRNIKEALLVNQPKIDGNLPLPPRDSHPHITEGFDPN